MAINSIEIAAQMSKMLQQQSKFLETQNKLVKAQYETTKALVKTLSQVPVKEISDNFKVVNQAIEEADKAVNNMSDSTKNLGETAKNASKNFSGFGTDLDKLINKGLKISSFGMAINTAVGSFKLLGSTVGSIIDVFSTLSGVLFDIGLSIISAPFKWLGSLISSAGAGGSSEFAQAINDVRKEFGELATNEAKAVMTAFRGIRGDLAETGISAYRILGNYAERLKYITELAKQMGPAFTPLKESFKDPAQAERMAVYQKGLGLTEEGVRGLADRAVATGKSFQELGREITTYAFQMGDAFGISGKIISRSVGEMSKDMKNFGSLGIKQMTQVALYTKKLGIEVKDLTGLIDKFDNFEDAAEGAAQLSQAFGLNIDALQMMKEQDPAKRFEMLRSEFVKTGKDINALTRQERALLAAQTGLSDEALLKGFSKQAMSYDEITKAGDQAEKKQLSQAEAMDKLAMSMERLVKGGGGMSGFFDAFIQGLTRGIRMSGPFREMFRSIQRALQATRLAGMEVGAAIVKFWPGLKDIFGGVRDFFKQIGSLTMKGKAVGFIKTFATTLIDFIKNPSGGIQGFIKNLQEKLGPMFDINGPILQKIIRGAKSSFTHLMKIMAEVVKFGVEQITSFLKSGSGFLKALRTGNWDELFSGAQNGFMKFVSEIFKPLIDVFKDGKLYAELKKAFFSFAEEAWLTIKDAFNKFVWPKITKFWEDNWVMIIGIGSAVIAGPAIVGLLAASIIKGGLMALARAAIFLIPKVASFFTGIFKSNEITSALGSLGGAGSVAGKAQGEMSKVDFKGLKMSGKDFAIALGALVVTVVALGGFVYAWNEWFSDLTIDKVIAPLAVMTSAAIAMVPMSIAMKTLENVKISPGMLLSLGVGIAALSVTVLLMAGTFNILKYGLADVNMTDVIKIGAVIGAMTMAYTAAAGVMVASGLIGTILTFTGIFGAGAMLAGFASLALTVTTMVMHAGTIIEKIKSTNIDESFGTKAKAFGIVISFYSDIAKIASTFLSEGLITGVIDRITDMWGASPEEKLNAKLATIQGFMTAIIDKTKEIILTTGMTGDISKLSSLALIMSSVGNMFKTFLPSVEAFKNVDKLDFVLKSVQGHVQSLANTFKTMIIPAITSLVNETLTSLSIVKPEDIEKLSRVFEMVTSLFSVLTPSPDLINSFKEYQDQQKGDDFYKKGSINVDAMEVGMKALGTSFQALITSGLGSGGWLNSTIDFISVIGDKFKGKNTNSLNSALDSFMKAFDSIKVITSYFMDQNESSGPLEVGSIQSFFSKINIDVVKAMNDGISNLDSNFQTIDENIITTQTVRIDKIKNSLVKFVQTINDQDSQLNNLATNTQPINVKLEKIADKIGIKDKSEFLIQRGELNILVNLNVAIDAEDLINVIKDKKVFNEK